MERGVAGVGVAVVLTLASGLLSLGTGVAGASYASVEEVRSALAEEGLPCRAYTPDRRAREGEQAGTCAIGEVVARVSVWESAEDRELARRERVTSGPGVDVDGPRWSVSVPDLALAEQVAEAIGGEVQPSTP